MKRMLFCVLLIAECILLTVLVLLTDFFPRVFSSLLAFPFEQIGALVQTMSLKGNIGNGFAFLLIVAIALLPLLAAFRKKSGIAEKLVLCVLSVLLFSTHCVIANPGIIYAVIPWIDESLFPGLKGVLGVTVWSVCILWVVLILLRRSTDSSKKLFVYIKVLLYALCVCFSGIIAVSCVGELASELKNSSLPVDFVISVFRFIVDVLPYVADIAVTVSVITVLDRFTAGERRETSVAAGRLAVCCRVALITVTASNAVFNILQLILLKELSQVNANVKIPLLSLVFVLAVLLAARIISENGRLADENTRLSDENERLTDENEAFI